MQKLNLTKREREVLLLGAEGLTDKEIASRLGLSHTTVSTHWANMRTKLEASSRGQLIAKAMVTVYRETQAELAHTSEIYRVLVETLEDFAVFMLDGNRRLTSWNPGVEKVLGYRQEEWIGQSGDVIFTEEDRRRGAPEEEQRTAEREGKAMDDRWHLRKDGSRLWVSGVMVPLRNDAGETVCYSKILRDLTWAKRLEEKVNRSES